MKLLKTCLMLIVMQGAPCLLTCNALASQIEARESCLWGRIVPADGKQASRKDVVVTLWGQAYSEFCNAVLFGNFRFCNVPGGDYTLEATASGFEVARIELRRWSGRDLDSNITIVLQPKLNQPAPHPGPKAVHIKSLSVPGKARNELNRFLEHAANKDWEKSLASLKKAIEIYPDYFDAWMNMGIVYSKMNRLEDAESAYKRAIEIDAESALPRRDLGYLYMRRRQFGKALAELEKAASSNPSDARTQAYLGYAFNQIENPAAAEEHLKRALALQPDMPMALYELGFAQIRLNQHQEALKSFERFLDQGISSPASDEVRNLVLKLRASAK